MRIDKFWVNRRVKLTLDDSTTRKGTLQRIRRGVYGVVGREDGLGVRPSEELFARRIVEIVPGYWSDPDPLRREKRATKKPTRKRPFKR
jgi:hypothetical protein